LSQFLQEIDEKAPDIWHRMMRHRVPDDFYEDLSSCDMSIVDSWRGRRDAILRDRMLGEMNAKLEEHGQESSPSTRFFRVQVRGSDDAMTSQPSAEAMLTIWNPSDEHLEEIKDGSVLRVKNLDVKTCRFDGLIQLSAGTGSPMQILSQGRPDSAAQGYANLFRLFLASSRVSVDLSTKYRYREEAVVGVVLRVERLDGHGWSIFLADESGMMLHVKSVIECKDLQLRLSSLSRHACENVQGIVVVAAFQRLRVTGVDVKRSCVAAMYMESSSFDPNPQGHRVLNLKQWSASSRGQTRLLQLASCLDTDMKRPLAPQLRVVGYTSGFHLLPKKQLVIQVDCGDSQLKALKFPLSLIPSFADSCEDLSGLVFLGAEHESKIEPFQRLGRILRSRRTLYIFCVRHITESLTDFPEIDFEVTHVAPADSRALSSLYSTLRVDHS
jgi:hypothetical protein